MEDKFLTPREVADIFRVAEMTVYTWVKRGQLPAVRVGKLIRIRQSDVEAFAVKA